MTGEPLWRDLLSDRVVSICKKHDIWETDCQPLVSKWILDINEDSRPTVSGVINESKRKLWNLEPLPF